MLVEAFYDRGRTFPLKCFLDDGAPLSKIVGRPTLFRKIFFLYAWAIWDYSSWCHLSFADVGFSVRYGAPSSEEPPRIFRVNLYRRMPQYSRGPSCSEGMRRPAIPEPCTAAAGTIPHNTTAPVNYTVSVPSGSTGTACIYSGQAALLINRHHKGAASALDRRKPPAPRQGVSAGINAALSAPSARYPTPHLRD